MGFRVPANRRILVADDGLDARLVRIPEGCATDGTTPGPAQQRKFRRRRPFAPYVLNRYTVRGRSGLAAQHDLLGGSTWKPYHLSCELRQRWQVIRVSRATDHMYFAKVHGPDQFD